MTPTSARVIANDTDGAKQRRESSDSDVGVKSPAPVIFQNLSKKVLRAICEQTEEADKRINC